MSTLKSDAVTAVTADTDITITGAGSGIVKLGDGALKFMYSAASAAGHQVYMSTTTQLATVAGNRVLVGTASASNVTTIDFDGVFTSAYTNYYIEAWQVNPATDDVDFWVRLDANGGDSFDTGGTDYASNGSGTTGATARDYGTNSTKGRIGFGEVASSIGLRNGTNDSLSLFGTVFNPLSTTYYTRFDYCGGYRETGTNWATIQGSISRTGAVADDSIQFLMESGNFDAEIRIYGIVDA